VLRRVGGHRRVHHVQSAHARDERAALPDVVVDAPDSVRRQRRRVLLRESSIDHDVRALTADPTL